MHRALNPNSVRDAEKDVNDSIDIENQDDILQISSQIIKDLRTSLDVVENKINKGGLDGANKPNLTARRMAILDVVRGVIEDLGQSIRGGSTPTSTPEPTTPAVPGAPKPAGLDTTQGGYGAWSQDPQLSSVQNKGTLTEDYMNKSSANPSHKFG